jgi:hypothetical protein
MNTNLFPKCFSMQNSKILLELLYHPQFLCDGIFSNAILTNLDFYLDTSMTYPRCIINYTYSQYTLIHNFTRQVNRANFSANCFKPSSRLNIRTIA